MTILVRLDPRIRLTVKVLEVLALGSRLIPEFLSFAQLGKKMLLVFLSDSKQLVSPFHQGVRAQIYLVMMDLDHMGDEQVEGCGRNHDFGAHR